jgi:hypothetical protein
MDCHFQASGQTSSHIYNILQDKVSHYFKALRKLCNEEFVLFANSMMMRCASHEACMGEDTTFKAENLKRPRGRHIHRQEDNVKINNKVAGKKYID